jgi:hypothetical protein
MVRNTIISYEKVEYVTYITYISSMGFFLKSNTISLSYDKLI